MKKILRAFSLFIFILYISFHFFIPQGSHLHLCCDTLELKLCTLDEETHKIDKILYHLFHNKRLKAEHVSSIAKKYNETEKHLHLTFLSSRDTQKTHNNIPPENFIPCYFVFPIFLILFYFIFDNYKSLSPVRNHTSFSSRSPPEI